MFGRPRYGARLGWSTHAGGYGPQPVLLTGTGGV